MRQPPRSGYEKRTRTSFRKTYGDRVYTFTHLRFETSKSVSAVVAVYVKPRLNKVRTEGDIVHFFKWQTEIKEHS